MIQPILLLLLIGAAILEAPRAQRLAVLAALAGGLGLAGLRAGPGPVGMADLAASVPPLPPGFVAVTGALFLTGLGLAIAAAAVATRPPRSSRTFIGGAFLLAGAVGLGGWAARMVTTAPTGGVALSVLVVLVLGGALARLRRLGRPAAVPVATGSGGPVAALALLLGGVVLAAAGTHLAAVFAGVVAVGFGGFAIGRTAGAARVPVVPLLVLLLAPAFWFLATVAGPEGLSIASLPMLPVSPAAERLIAPVLLLAAWSVSGLWPLHRQVPAALAAPAGALLLVRVGMIATPAGLAHWRALAMPVVVAGLWSAALGGRRVGLAVGIAWVGLLAGGGPGVEGAGLALAAAVAIELAGAVPGRAVNAASGLRGLALVLAGCGALLVVEAGLQVEVVYTVLAVAALVTATGRSGDHAMMASAPSAGAPSR